MARFAFSRVVFGDLMEASFGAKVAWIAFLLTSLQLAFLKPYVVIIEGQRANVFSALLCGGALVMAWLFRSPENAQATRREVVVSIVLFGLVLLSGLFGLDPTTSLIRGFVMAIPAVAGFWCSRLLLGEGLRRSFFVWLCLAMLGATILLVILSAVVTGEVHRFLDSHWHPVGSRLLLWSMAPMVLLLAKARWRRVLGAIFLLASYVALVLCGRSGMESMAIIPPVVCLVVACVWPWSRRQLAGLLLGLVALFLIMSGLLYRNAANLDKQHESVAYRIENVFFSWKIATSRPLLGIGLWAPRDQFLENHEMTYSHVSKEQFVKWTHGLRTSENLLLTFLADLGFPFVLLYGTALLFLFGRVVQGVLQRSAGFVISPLALLVPILAAVLHFQVWDGLFQPQISWFFHVLLGLVPGSSENKEPFTRAGWRKLGLRLIFCGAAAILGGVLGIWLSQRGFLRLFS